MKAKEIKAGQWVYATPGHTLGGLPLRWRKVTAVCSKGYSWRYSGIAVRAHGYSEFWLRDSEIMDSSDTRPQTP